MRSRSSTRGVKMASGLTEQIFPSPYETMSRFINDNARGEPIDVRGYGRADWCSRGRLCRDEDHPICEYGTYLSIAFLQLVDAALVKVCLRERPCLQMIEASLYQLCLCLGHDRPCWGREHHDANICLCWGIQNRAVFTRGSAVITGQVII